MNRPFPPRLRPCSRRSLAAYAQWHEQPIRIRRARGRRRACRDRGGAGGRAAGSADGAAHDQLRHRRPDELQPGHRRRGQGADRPRDRRPGRRDGPGDRRHRHSVPHAQSPQGPGDAQPAGPGRQEGVSGRDQAARRRAAEPHAAAGSGRGSADRRTSEARRSAAQQRIIGVRVRGDAVYRARAVVLTTGTFLQALMHTGEAKTPGGRAGEGTTAGISGALARLGFRAGPLQDRHAAAAQRPHDRLRPDASCSRATTTRSRSRFSPIGSTSSSCPAGSPTPTKRSTS